MAQISHVLARLQKDPIPDLPLASAFHQVLRDCDHRCRDRLLTPGDVAGCCSSRSSTATAPSPPCDEETGTGLVFRSVERGLESLIGTDKGMPQVKNVPCPHSSP